MQCRDSAPTLRRVGIARYLRKLRQRKSKDGFKRLVKRVAFARWYAHLCEFGKKLREVVIIVPPQKRRGSALPFVARSLNLSQGQIPSDSFLHCCQIARKLEAFLFAYVARARTRVTRC